jgi:hypothetical protein
LRTKAFHAFEQKLIYFEDDIELIDVIRTSVINGDLTEKESHNVLKNIDPTLHAHISRRKNSDGSRKLIVNHLRSTLYSAYVKDVYEELTAYLRTILRQAAENGFDAGRIIGDHSIKLDAKSVLEEGNWENVARLITDSVFQSLEAEKSTLKLLKKIAAKLAIKIDDSLIETVLPYLEVRHFLVHSDGKVSKEFIKKYPHIKRNNEDVRLSYQFISTLRDSIKNLVVAYDKEVIAANLLKAEDTQP